jgi:hypothetical protein
MRDSPAAAAHRAASMPGFVLLIDEDGTKSVQLEASYQTINKIHDAIKKQMDRG